MMGPLTRMMVATLIVGIASPASASNSADLATAKRLFQEAEQDQRNSRWAEALDKLERVVAIKETPGVRFHIAVCQEKLGRLVKSLESYERARELATSAHSEDVLEMVGPEIDRMQSRIARIQIHAPSNVGTLVVHVDQSVHAGIPAGNVLRVDPGTHHVVVKIDGTPRLDRLVSLEEGQSETLEVKDWRVAAASEPAPEAAPSVERGVEGTGSGIPTGAWISLGVGAALGVGGYLAYAKADSLAEESAVACAASIACDPARADTVRNWDALALGMWIGAAVGIGTGVALIMTHGDASQPATSMIVSPTRVQLRTTF
jgi:tetratricopeptide (TPR) repeat protein